MVDNAPKKNLKCSYGAKGIPSTNVSFFFLVDAMGLVKIDFRNLFQQEQFRNYFNGVRNDIEMKKLMCSTLLKYHPRK